MHTRHASALARSWTRTVVYHSLICVGAACKPIGMDRALEMLDQKLAGVSNPEAAAPGSARAELEAAGLVAGMPSGGAAVPSGDLP